MILQIYNKICFSCKLLKQKSEINKIEKNFWIEIWFKCAQLIFIKKIITI